MVLERVINSDIPAIREYMKNGQELRVENTKHLAEIKASCDANQAYQLRCEDKQDTLDGRVATVEKKQTWQSGIAAGVAAVVSFIGWIVTNTKA